MPDFDDEDIDVCTSCGRYFGWAGIKDIVDALPELRPFPQQCRRCLTDRGFAPAIDTVMQEG